MKAVKKALQEVKNDSVTFYKILENFVRILKILQKYIKLSNNVQDLVRICKNMDFFCKRLIDCARILQFLQD